MAKFSQMIDPKKEEVEREARQEASWKRLEDNRRGAFEFKFIRDLTRADAPRRRFPHDAFQD